MSSTQERYGIIFDAQVEIDKIDLAMSDEMYQEVAKKLEAGAEPISKAATKVGQTAGTALKEGIKASIQGVGEIVSEELRSSIAAATSDGVKIDPNIDRAAFRKSLDSLFEGLDTQMSASLTKGLAAGVKTQVLAGVKEAQTGLSTETLQVDAEIRLTNNVNDAVREAQLDALQMLDVKLRAVGIENLDALMQELSLKLRLDEEGSRVIASLQTLRRSLAQPINLKIRLDEKSFDVASLGRAAADAGRRAAAAAATAFERGFKQRLSQMRLDVNVNARMGAVTPATGGGRPPSTPPVVVPPTTRVAQQIDTERAAMDAALDAQYGLTPSATSTRATPPAVPPTTGQPTSAQRPPTAPVTGRSAPQQTHVSPYAPSEKIDNERWARTRAHMIRAGMTEREVSAYHAKYSPLGTQAMAADIDRRLDVPGYERYAAQMRAGRQKAIQAGTWTSDVDAPLTTSFAAWQAMPANKRERLSGGKRVDTAIPNEESPRVRWKGGKYDYDRERYFGTSRGIGHDPETGEILVTMPTKTDKQATKLGKRFGQMPGNRSLVHFEGPGIETFEPMQRVSREGAAPMTAQRALVSYTLQGSPTTDGTALVDERIRPVIRRTTDAWAEKEEVTPESLYQVGDVIPMGEAQKLARGSTATFGNNKMDQRVTHVEQVRRGDGRIGLRYTLQSEGTMAQGRTDSKGFAAKASEQAHDMSGIRTVYAGGSRAGQFLETTPTMLTQVGDFGAVAQSYLATQDWDNEMLATKLAPYIPESRRAGMMSGIREGKFSLSELYEPGLAYFNAEVVPEHTTVSEWMEPMAPANALAHLRMTTGRQDITMREGMELGLLRQGANNNIDFVRREKTLTLPQLKESQEDYAVRSRFISADVLRQMDQHNPRLAASLREQGAPVRQSMAELYNAHQVAAGKVVAPDGVGAPVELTRDDMSRIAEVARRNLVNYYEDQGEAMPAEKDIALSVRNNAFLKALDETGWGEGEDGMRRLRVGNQDAYLPGAAALSRYAGLGGLDEEFELNSTSLARRTRELIEAGATGDPKAIEQALAGYQHAQAEVVGGKDFGKQMQGTLAKQGNFVGDVLRVSEALAPDKAYVPGLRAGAIAAFGYPTNLEGTAGDIHNLSREEAVALGLNPELTYTSRQIAQAMGRDTDGDKAYFAVDPNALSADRGAVARRINSRANAAVLSGAGNLLTAQYGDKAGQGLLGGNTSMDDFAAVLAQDPTLANEMAQMVASKSAISRMTPEQAQGFMNRYNELLTDIGPVHNAVGPQLRASILDSQDAEAARAAAQVFDAAYGVAQRPEAQNEHMEKVLTTLGAGRRSLASQKGTRFNAGLARMTMLQGLAAQEGVDIDGNKQWLFDEKAITAMTAGNEADRAAIAKQVADFRAGKIRVGQLGEGLGTSGEQDFATKSVGGRAWLAKSIDREMSVEMRLAQSKGLEFNRDESLLRIVQRIPQLVGKDTYGAFTSTRDLMFARADEVNRSNNYAAGAMSTFAERADGTVDTVQAAIRRGWEAEGVWDEADQFSGDPRSLPSEILKRSLPANHPMQGIIKDLNRMEGPSDLMFTAARDRLGELAVANIHDLNDEQIAMVNQLLSPKGQEKMHEQQARRVRVDPAAMPAGGVGTTDDPKAVVDAARATVADAPAEGLRLCDTAIANCEQFAQVMGNVTSQGSKLQESLMRLAALMDRITGDNRKALGMDPDGTGPGDPGGPGAPVAPGTEEPERKPLFRTESFHGAHAAIDQERLSAIQAQVRAGTLSVEEGRNLVEIEQAAAYQGESGQVSAMARVAAARNIELERADAVGLLGMQRSSTEDWRKVVNDRLGREHMAALEAVFQGSGLRERYAGIANDSDAFSAFTRENPELTANYLEHIRNMSRTGTSITDERQLGMLSRDMLRAVDTPEQAALAMATTRSAVDSARFNTKAFADYMQYRQDPNSVTFSDDAVRNQARKRDLSFMRGAERPAERALLDAGDMNDPATQAAFQRISRVGMQRNDLLRMGQNAMANSAAFMVSSTLMRAFGAIAQQVQQYESGLKAAGALANMAPQSIDGRALFRQARGTAARLGGNAQEVLGAVREYVRDSDRDPREALRQLSALGPRIQATGESLKEAAEFMKAARTAGIDNVGGVSKFLVGRGVTLGQGAGFAQQLQGMGLDDRRIQRIIVGMAQSGDKFTLSANERIRGEQLERLERVGAMAPANRQAAMYGTSFEDAARNLSNTLQELWEILRPGLTLLAGFFAGVGGVINLGLRATNLLGPFKDLAVVIAALTASVITANAVFKLQSVKGLVDVFKASGAQVFGWMKDMFVNAQLAGRLMAPGMGAAIGGTRVGRSVQGMWAQHVASSQRLGILPGPALFPMHADYGGPLRGAGAAEGANRAARATAANRAAAAARAARAGQTVSGVRGAASVGMGALTGLFAPMAPLALTAGALGLLGYGVSVGVKNMQKRAADGGMARELFGLNPFREEARRPRTWLEEQQLRRETSVQGWKDSINNFILPVPRGADQARVSALASGYAGELTLEMERAGYTTEELQEQINRLARSSNPRIRSMANEVRDLAKSYAAVTTNLQAYQKSFEVTQQRIMGTVSGSGMMALDVDSPLLALIDPSQRLGSAYAAATYSGLLLDERTRPIDAEARRDQSQIDAYNQIMLIAQNSGGMLPGLNAGTQSLFRAIFGGEGPDAFNVRQAPIARQYFDARAMDRGYLEIDAYQDSNYAAIMETLRTYGIEADMRGNSNPFNEFFNRTPRQQLERALAGTPQLFDRSFDPEMLKQIERLQLVRVTPEQAQVFAPYVAYQEAERQLREDAGLKDGEVFDANWADRQKLGLDKRLEIDEARRNLRTQYQQQLFAFVTNSENEGQINALLGSTMRERLASTSALFGGREQFGVRSLSQVGRPAALLRLEEQEMALTRGLAAVQRDFAEYDNADLTYDSEGLIEGTRENIEILAGMNKSLADANQDLMSLPMHAANLDAAFARVTAEMRNLRVAEFVNDWKRNMSALGILDSAASMSTAAQQIDPSVMYRGVFDMFQAGDVLPGKNLLEAIENGEFTDVADYLTSLAPGAFQAEGNYQARMVAADRAVNVHNLGPDAGVRMTETALRRFAENPVAQEMVTALMGGGDLGDNMFTGMATQDVLDHFVSALGLEGYQAPRIDAALNRNSMDLAAQAAEVSLATSRANAATVAGGITGGEAAVRAANTAAADAIRNANINAALQRQAAERRFAATNADGTLVGTPGQDSYGGFAFTTAGAIADDFQQEYNLELRRIDAERQAAYAQASATGKQAGDQASLAQLDFERQKLAAQLNFSARTSMDLEIAQLNSFIASERNPNVSAAATDRRDQLLIQRDLAKAQAPVSTRNFERGYQDLMAQLVGIPIQKSFESLEQYAYQIQSDPNIDDAEARRLGVSRDRQFPIIEDSRLGALGRMFTGSDEQMNRITRDYAPMLSSLEQARSLRLSLGDTLEYSSDELRQRFDDEVRIAAQRRLATAAELGEELTPEQAERLAREEMLAGPLGQAYEAAFATERFIEDQRRQGVETAAGLAATLFGDTSSRDFENQRFSLERQIADSTELTDEGRAALTAQLETLNQFGGALDAGAGVLAQLERDTAGMTDADAFEARKKALQDATDLIREQGALLGENEQAERLILGVYGPMLASLERQNLERERTLRINELQIQQARTMAAAQLAAVGPTRTMGTGNTVDAMRALSQRNLSNLQAQQAYEAATNRDVINQVIEQEGLKGLAAVARRANIIGTARDTRDAAIATADQQLAESATQSVLGMLSGPLGVFESLGDRVGAIDQLGQFVPDEDRARLAPSVRALRDAASGDLGQQLESYLAGQFRGEKLSAQGLQTLAAAVLTADPAVQGLVGDTLTQALAGSQPMMQLAVAQARVTTQTSAGDLALLNQELGILEGMYAGQNIGSLAGKQGDPQALRILQLRSQREVMQEQIAAEAQITTPLNRIMREMEVANRDVDPATQLENQQAALARAEGLLGGIDVETILNMSPDQLKKRFGATADAMLGLAQTVDGLRVSTSNLDKQLSTNERIVEPMRAIMRGLDDDVRNVSNTEELELRQRALGKFQEVLGDWDPQAILNMSEIDLAKTFKEDAGAMRDLAQAMKDGGLAIDALTLQIARMAEVARLTSAQRTLSDLQYEGASEEAIMAQFGRVQGEQSALLARYIDPEAMGYAERAIRRGNMDELAKYITPRQGDTQEDIDERAKTAAQLFNEMEQTERQRIATRVQLSTRDVQRDTLEAALRGELTPEMSLQLLEQANAAIRGVLEEEGMNDPNGPMGELVRLLETGNAGGGAVFTGMQAANQLLDQDTNLMLAGGNFEGALAAARGQSGNTRALIASMWDAEKYGAFDFSADPMVQQLRLNLANMNEAATMLGMDDAREQRILAGDGRDRMERLNARLQANQPLYRSPTAMLEFERQQLEATNRMLEETGLKDSSREMAEIYAANLQRMINITEDKGLALRSAWNDVLSGAVTDLQQTVTKMLSTILYDVVFGDSGKERRDLDRNMERERDFAQSEADYNRNRGKDIRGRLDNETLSPEDRRMLENEYMNTIRNAEEYEATVRRINHEWEIQADKIETVGEKLLAILETFSRGIIDRIMNFVTDLGFSMLLGSLTGMSTGDIWSAVVGKAVGGAAAVVGGSAAVTPTAAPATQSFVGDGPSTTISGTDIPNTISLSTSSASAPKADGVDWAGGLSAAASSYAFADQGGLGAGLLSAGVSFAMSGFNPVVGGLALAGAAIGEVVGNIRWWNQKLREEAGSSVQSIADFGIGNRRIGQATWRDAGGVDMNVSIHTNNLHSYDASREIAKNIQQQGKMVAARRGILDV